MARHGPGGKKRHRAPCPGLPVNLAVRVTPALKSFKTTQPNQTSADNPEMKPEVPIASHLAQHLRTRLRDGRVIATTTAERRLAMRSIFRLAADSHFLAVTLVDAHLHLLARCSPGAASALVHAIEASLRQRLALPVGFAMYPHEAVRDARHLRNAFRYMPGQAPREHSTGTRGATRGPGGSRPPTPSGGGGNAAGRARAYRISAQAPPRGPATRASRATPARTPNTSSKVTQSGEVASTFGESVGPPFRIHATRLCDYFASRISGRSSKVWKP